MMAVADNRGSSDSLNRLKDATETGLDSQSWKQTFTFDRYGNRNFDTANTTTIPAGCPTAVCNPTVDPATNKLVSYQFDNGGNTKVDANGQTFIYDTENKQVQVSNTSGIVGSYFYDGDGKRVKKVVPSTGETTIFVYDSLGRSVAEYSTIVTNSTDAKVAYLTSDHLGSPRINTDAVGNVIARHDYHPFGEEIATSQRTTGLNYSGDPVRKKFTGYERDDETGLDFAQARMYAKGLGRFSGCDPIYTSKDHPSNPQKWNAYIYVINNPLGSTDPTGLKPKVIDIFITVSVEERNGNNAKRDWYELAKKAPKGTVVHVYTVDDKTATVEQFAKSLKSPGRTVIVYGHSTATEEDQKNAVNGGGKLQGIGLHFSNGDVVDNVVGSKIINAVKASSLLLFTCASGNTSESLRSRMNGGEMLRMDGGPDGETSVKGNEEAAYAATGTLISGGTMTQAQTAAQTAIDRNGQDDSTILYFANPTGAAGYVRRKK